MANKKQETEIKKLANFLDTEFLPGIYGERVGFIVLISRFDQADDVADYISNGNRETCIEWLKETIERFEAGQTIPASEGEA